MVSLGATGPAQSPGAERPGVARFYAYFEAYSGFYFDAYSGFYFDAYSGFYFDAGAGIDADPNYVRFSVFDSAVLGPRSSAKT